MPHVESMNGFIIETTCANEKARGGQEAFRWIGIRESARDMISALPGHSPSVVDRGPAVLEHARDLGLKDSEFQRLMTDHLKLPRDA